MPTEAPMHTDVHVYAIQHPFSTPNRLVIGSQCPVEDQIATTYTTPPTESNFASLSISTYLQQGLAGHRYTANHS